MTSDDDPKKERIDAYIDKNLKQLFAELEADDMPTEITDLLSVLRAQDQNMKGGK